MAFVRLCYLGLLACLQALLRSDPSGVFRVECSASACRFMGLKVVMCIPTAGTANHSRCELAQ